MSLRALESSSIVLSEKYRVHGVIFTRNIRNIDLTNIEFQEIRNTKVWIFHFFNVAIFAKSCSNATDFILGGPRAREFNRHAFQENNSCIAYSHAHAHNDLFLKYKVVGTGAQDTREAFPLEKLLHEPSCFCL